MALDFHINLLSSATDLDTSDLYAKVYREGRGKSVPVAAEGWVAAANHFRATGLDIDTFMFIHRESIPYLRIFYVRDNRGKGVWEIRRAEHFYLGLNREGSDFDGKDAESATYAALVFAAMYKAAKAAGVA